MDSKEAANTVPKPTKDPERAGKAEAENTPFVQRLGNFAAYALATGLGSGFSPRAPGTVGTVLGVLIFFPVARFSWMIQLLFIGFFFILGLWSAGRMEKITKRHDDQRIVIDEWLGVWIALWALPPSWAWWTVAFFLFRVLDIAKPFPANWADRKWAGAKGVIMDDVISGVYAAAMVRAGQALLRLM